MSQVTGAAAIARTLKQVGVEVIFGIVGIPVVQIAEEAIALGIRYIGFRNEQAASYAATAYGYITGKPGICLVVGGPGVLHAIAGIGNSSANAFPLLLLAGSCESNQVNKGAFQELDAVALLTPLCKSTARVSAETLSIDIASAFRVSWYGRPGPSFVDLPADIIQRHIEENKQSYVLPPPRSGPDPDRILAIAHILRNAKAPLLVVGKGAAFARAETVINQLVDETKIPFLPTPMGKGVLPDSHHLNVASARSAALKETDVVLVLGARLNWILHFGEEPKWKTGVKLIQVDISAEEIGKNNGDASTGIVGDINIVVPQLLQALKAIGWACSSTSSYSQNLSASKKRNETKAKATAKIQTQPMGYSQVFNVVKATLNSLSPPETGNIVYISEGANTMDISRSIFNVEKPRLRLDAGTHATMGVGLGYAIAAHAAYNPPHSQVSHKKIVCIEGDSAFGFSMAEVETMARYSMDILIFVINNGGIYHGDSSDSESWLKLQRNTVEGGDAEGLRSTSLGWEVGYEKTAQMCGGKGYLVHTEEELRNATVDGFQSKGPVLINVIIEAGQTKKLVSRAPVQLYMI
jgi:2-hydroxyacyl-CoA lyase 1